ncbi:MAG: hypothetical protein U0R68_16905 [Candidatus Nanopelagicales bacterium]
MPFRPLHRALLKGHVRMSPKPPFFVTNKTGRPRQSRDVPRDRQAAGAAGMFASALRG